MIAPSIAARNSKGPSGAWAASSFVQMVVLALLLVQSAAAYYRIDSQFNVTNATPVSVGNGTATLFEQTLPATYVSLNNFNFTVSFTSLGNGANTVASSPSFNLNAFYVVFRDNLNNSARYDAATADLNAGRGTISLASFPTGISFTPNTAIGAYVFWEPANIRMEQLNFSMLAYSWIPDPAPSATPTPFTLLINPEINITANIDTPAPGPNPGNVQSADLFLVSFSPVFIKPSGFNFTMEYSIAAGTPLSYLALFFYDNTTPDPDIRTITDFGTPNTAQVWDTQGWPAVNVGPGGFFGSAIVYYPAVKFNYLRIRVYGYNRAFVVNVGNSTTTVII